MIYILTLTFFILQLLDWYTTRTILKNGGYEQNPEMAFVFKYVNVDVALAIKAIITSVIGYFIGVIYPLMLVVLIIIYLAVVIHNGKSLWR
jgi:type III secretory pathway component EscU